MDFYYQDKLIVKSTANILKEACGNYLNWVIYNHK